MDQAMVDWAVTAMDLGDDTTRVEQWFTLLTSAYHDPDEGEPVASWDEFVARLYPAAERDGFDSADVQLFAESLRDSSSDPIGDVLLPMYEQRDNLPQEYLDLRAARADGTVAYDAGHLEHDAAESPESDWHWDDVRQIWHHLEGGEWIAQVQDGQALNYDRTEWVPRAPEALDSEAGEEPVSADVDELSEANEPVAAPEPSTEELAPEAAATEPSEGVEAAEATESVDSMSATVNGILDDAIQHVLDDAGSIAAELGISEADLVALLADLPDDFVNEVVSEVAAEVAAEEAASPNQ